jgi:hypothetical protein
VSHDDSLLANYHPACPLILYSCSVYTGRTTKFGNDPGAEQNSISDCYVKPGFGIYFSNTSSWTVPEGTTVPTDKIPEDESIKVMECPAGYYGPGGIAANTLNSLCMKCAPGSSAAAGSTTAADRSGGSASCKRCT